VGRKRRFWCRRMAALLVPPPLSYAHRWSPLRRQRRGTCARYSCGSRACGEGQNSRGPLPTPEDLARHRWGAHGAAAAPPPSTTLAVSENTGPAGSPVGHAPRTHHFDRLGRRGAYFTQAHSVVFFSGRGVSCRGGSSGGIWECGANSTQLSGADNPRSRWRRRSPGHRSSAT